ncbi:MAG: ANTAR domain-containing protein [Lachnospiraceae bacterium]|nr:ANTAR domain-containing protein [Lachnospiraceae bacterium]
MGSVIIAIPNPDTAEKIGDVLRRRGFPPTAMCTLGSEVLRHAGDAELGVVICTKRLKDMSCTELFEYLPEYFNVLLLSSDDTDFGAREGIMRLSNPFRPSDLVNTVDLMLSTLERQVKKTRRRPARSPEDQKVIDEAKHLLMDRNDMTEPEAFRYIQKTSMDTGRTMVESAQMVLMLNWDR